MTSEPSVLLVGLSHKNMLATVGAINELGLQVRELKSLPPSARSLSGTSALTAAAPERPVPRWLPRRTRSILAAADESCVAIVSRGGRSRLGPRRGRDAVLAGLILRVPVIVKTELEVFWEPRRIPLAARTAIRVRAAAEWLFMEASGAVFLSPTRGVGSARRRPGYRYLPHLVDVTLDRPPVLPERPLRVITVTRCRRSKNNAGLLELARRLHGDDIRFTIVFGEDASCPKCGGTGFRDFQEQVEDAGVSNLRLLGPTSDLTHLYRSHHVVLRNSLGEGANVTVIEGAAEGCAVMVSSTSGAGHGLFDELGGVIVEAEDLDAQAAFLRQLLADPVLRDRLRKEAMEVVRQRCDPAQFRNLLEGLITRRGPRRT